MTEETESVDDRCICKGNWRLIVSESEALIGRTFVDSDGSEANFFGLVHGQDDYYYGFLSKTKGIMLLSCVGSIEAYGLTLKGE